MTKYRLDFFSTIKTARAGRADFIQPSLGPLQPNFDDLMDLDIGTYIDMMILCAN